MDKNHIEELRNRIAKATVFSAEQNQDTVQISRIDARKTLIALDELIEPITAKEAEL